MIHEGKTFVLGGSDLNGRGLYTEIVSNGSKARFQGIIGAYRNGCSISMAGEASPVWQIPTSQNMLTLNVAKYSYLKNITYHGDRAFAGTRLARFRGFQKRILFLLERMRITIRTTGGKTSSLVLGVPRNNFSPRDGPKYILKVILSVPAYILKYLE